MTKEEHPQTLLVVDDDTRLRAQLARAFEKRGYTVFTAGGFEEAVRLATAEAPELAVIDLRMPGPSGLELIRALKAIDPATQIVMLTGYGSIATTVEALRAGAVHYLQKPADADQILAAFDADGADTSHLGIEPPSLERVKWEHISRVLADSQDNVSEAARKLGLHRRSLQRMLQKFPPRE